jgi:transcriptional regulator with XRE-family HTH domain
MITDTTGIVAKRLRMARAEANLTQEDMAKKAGLSPHIVFNLETGRKKITVDYLVSMAIATGKPVSWFFEDIQEYLPVDSARSLRSANRDLPPEAAKELVDFVRYVMEKYGKEGT